MTSTFAAQLRTVAANSTNELDLRARRDAHAESLIFDKAIAVKQDWDTIYQICLEGFQELCHLDTRLQEFEHNLFSPQAKDQDREQLSKTQNEALGVVIERCLALLGSKVLLQPGVKAVEWLVRRFRVQVYNTSALLATFLPYHEMAVFRNILSIIPANKIVNEWKFLGPYYKIAANVPRHTVVYSATHNDAFFSYLNNYTLRLCQEGAGHPQLLRFWASVVTEAITARLNQLKSGRKEVQKQRLDDALLKILPLLVEGFEIQGSPEMTLTCFTIALVLVSNSDLEDGAIDSLMQTVAPCLTNGNADSKSALACLIILTAKKTDRRVSKAILAAFMKIRDLEILLLDLKDQVPLGSLFESLIQSSLTGLKKSNLDSRLSFVQKLFDISPGLLESQTISRLVAIVLRKLRLTEPGHTPEAAVRTRLVQLLQHLNDSTAFSSSFAEAALLADQPLAEVEAAIEGTIESFKSLPAPASMDVDEGDLKEPPNSRDYEAVLTTIPSQTPDLSFLATKDSPLFDQLTQAFALCHKSEAGLSQFNTLPLWEQHSEQPSDLQSTFFLRLACGKAPVPQRASALQLLAKTLEMGSRPCSPLVISYLTVLLADPGQSVRRATVSCLLALRRRLETNANGTDNAENTTDTVFHGVSANQLPVPQAVKILDLVYLPNLEECALDASHIGRALESTFDASTRSAANSSTTHAELKKSLKHDFFDFLIASAISSPLTKVKVRVIELLTTVQKVGTTSTSKALAPVLMSWASLSEADAASIALSEGLSVPYIDGIMVQIIKPQSKDAVEQALTMLNEQNAHVRAGLIAALCDRVASIWDDMRHETQITGAVLLFDMAFSKNGDLAKGGRDVLQSVTLSTEVLAALLDHACSSLAQMQMDVPPKKRRRISHGRDSIPRDVILELDVADSRLTFALELVDSSTPAAHPQLLGHLFELLIVLRRMKDKSTSESPYLLTLCLSNILAITNKAQEARKPTLDLSSIRADLVTDCIRSSENPQVQTTALLLAASLASLAPDRILHTIMPIFTFMGHRILSRDDERSIYVVNQAIDQIIPPLVSTLKHQDAQNLIHSTSSLLSSFVTAYDHIPQHRRTAFYQRLLDRLGADDFAFAIVALLASRKRSQDLSAFFFGLLGDLPAATQLSTHRKILDLVSDVFSANPHNAEPLLDITKSTKNDQKEQEALVLLDTASLLLGAKTLKAQVKRPQKMATNEIESFWAEYRKCLAQLLLMLQEHKAHHPALTPSTRDCLRSLLELPSLAGLLHTMPSLLQEMEQTGDKELQPLALRVLGTQLQQNAPKDAQTQFEAMSFLPSLETIINSTADEAFRHAAIACMDRIVEVYGRKSPDLVMSASSVLVDGEHGLDSPDPRTQIMSILCLTSMSEILKEATVPLVPQSMSKVLALLASSMQEGLRNAELHNAALSLVSSFISHAPFMISDENLGDILRLSHQSCLTEMESSCKESRVDALHLVARKIDLSTIIGSVSQAWQGISPHFNVEAVTEHMAMLSQAIERSSKSDVVRSADAISSFILQVLDLRRLTLSTSESASLSLDDVDQIESTLRPFSVTFIYKLNDTVFRPLFESWVDWAVKGRDLAVVEDYTDEAKAARETSLFGFLDHFFATLKSIVTSYASYILEPANEVLQATVAGSADVDAVPNGQLALYRSTLGLLTTALSHDADGFFASPSHFSPLSSLLISQLDLAAAKSKLLRQTVPNLVVPTIVALATATMDTPAHHHALNHRLCRLRHHASAAVRLAAIGTHLALTQSEDVGEEWVNNVVVGAATTEGGGGGSGETMVYVNESLEDDDEQVENEVRRWVRLVREMVGEDVFEV